MRAKIERDLKRRKLVAKYDKKRMALKKILSDKTISSEMRLIAQEALEKLPRNSSPVRLTNRCMLTGRLERFHVISVSPNKNVNLLYKKLQGIEIKLVI